MSGKIQFMSNIYIESVIQDEKKVIKFLKELDENYYNDISLISDEEYDNLREKVFEKYPDNDYFKKVGSPVKRSGLKVKHEIPMLSQQKAKTVEEVIKWKDKIEKATGKQFSYIIEGKIDGISCSLNYNHGKLIQISTRGNGITGEDITHIGQYINTIPKTIELNTKITVRGELYIPKDSTFVKEKRRNVCSGLINRKETNLEDLQQIKFVAFKLYGVLGKTEEKSLKILKDWKFKIVYADIILEKYNVNKFFKSDYEDYLKVYRDLWKYETDGIIIMVNDSEYHDEINSHYVIDHHNHFSIALKPPSLERTTTLKEVEWNLSHSGNFIPVAIFEEIDFDGIKVTRASLHNAKTVIDNNLKKGDLIIIERSGEVIPHFLGVFSHDVTNQLQISVNCYSCNSIVVMEETHLKCLNPECPEIQVQKIIYYVKKAEMDGFAEATIRLLYENGVIKNIKDLYELDKSYLNSLDIKGLGLKKCNNILKQIEKSKQCTIDEFIDRLGIELVGKKAIVKLGIESIIQFLEFRDSTYVIGQKIMEWKAELDNMRLFLAITKYIEIKQIIKGDINMKKVAMTGTGPMGRNDLIDKINMMGFEFDKSITKSTDILLCENVTGNSSKLQKARKNGIEIISYVEFFGV